MKFETKVAAGTALFLLALLVSGFLVQGRAPAQEPVQVIALAKWPEVNKLHGPKIIIPVKGVARSGLRDTWGAPRDGGRSHKGIDIMAPKGTPVVAATSGRILRLFNSEKGGTTLYQVDEDKGHIFYYAHLDRYADGVRPGMKVRQGEVIAYVGETGNAPVPHLHFEIQRPNSLKQWWRGEAFNPFPVLMAGTLEPPVRRGPVLARMK